MSLKLQNTKDKEKVRRNSTNSNMLQNIIIIIIIIPMERKTVDINNTRDKKSNTCLIFVFCDVFPPGFVSEYLTHTKESHMSIINVLFLYQ